MIRKSILAVLLGLVCQSALAEDTELVTIKSQKCTGGVAYSMSCIIIAEHQDGKTKSYKSYYRFPESEIGNQAYLVYVNKTPNFIPVDKRLPK